MILDRIERMLNMLWQNPLAFILLALCLLYSIIIHELAHGWVAYKMGDPTAKWMGRLSLNPLKHLDPIGTIMLFVFGFGWAKPVPVNFNNLRQERKGLIFVSAAGITANIILAFIALFIKESISLSPLNQFSQVLDYLAGINIMLASFNLIPIPPLDGSKILMGFATRRFQYSLMRLEPYGLFIVIALLYLGLLNPLIVLFRWIIMSVIGLFLSIV